MADSAPAPLIEEIDSRQDEVLARLDALNARIEDILKAWTASQLEDQAKAA